jgi:hypothetical protein
VTPKEWEASKVNLSELVESVLEEKRPANLDPTGPIVTGEGPKVETVILPHRDLDGLSLVAWTDDRSARLLWAYVGDLSTHDDLDLGVVVERIPYEGDWRGRVRDALVAELDRPIRLRRRRGFLGGQRVECWIVAGGKKRRIAVLRPPKNQLDAETEMTTSLSGGPRPRFSLTPAIR